MSIGSAKRAREDRLRLRHEFVLKLEAEGFPPEEANRRAFLMVKFGGKGRPTEARAKGIQRPAHPPTHVTVKQIRKAIRAVRSRAPLRVVTDVGGATVQLECGHIVDRRPGFDQPKRRRCSTCAAVEARGAAWE